MEVRRMALLLVFLATPAETAKGGQPLKPAVLFLVGKAQVSGDVYPFLVDPKHKAELNREGYEVGYCRMFALTWEKLRRFNCVVLTIGPAVGHVSREVWDKTRALLLRFVKEGGGLLCFTNLYRGMVAGRLNQLLEPLGAKVLPYPVVEGDKGRFRKVHPYSDLRAFLVDDISPSPITEGVRRLWFPAWHIHGAPTFVVDKNWKVVVRASKTAKALRPKRTKFKEPGYKNSPPLVAARSYGKGRVVLFASHSSWWCLNPYHMLWGEGFFLREGDGRRFLFNIYRWLCEPSLAAGNLGGFTEREQREIFDLDALIKSRKGSPAVMRFAVEGPWRQGIIGARSRFSGAPFSVSELCERARELGYDFLAFCEDGEKLWNREKWEAFVKECQENTKGGFWAIPGVRFLDFETGQEFGFVNPLRPWPDLDWTGLAFTSLIRISGPGGGGWGGALLFPLFPKRANVPFWVHGSIDAFPAECVGEGAREGSFELLFQAVADGWGFLPLAYREVDHPDDIPPPKQGVMRTFLALGRDFEPCKHGIGRAFVSSGPVLERFEASYPNPWLEREEKPVTVRLSVRSEAPLSKVEVYLGRKLLRSFKPERSRFEAEFSFRTAEAGRLILVAEDREGGRLLCPGPVVDVRVYRAFIGSDRMNGYWLVEEPEKAEREGDRVCVLRSRILGEFFPGLGWGPHIDFRSAAQMDVPIGIETGGPRGSARRFWIEPDFLTDRGREFFGRLGPCGYEPAPYRRFSLLSASLIVMEDEVSALREVWREPEGRKHIRVVPSRLFGARVKFSVPRWSGPVKAIIEGTVEAKVDVSLLPRPEIGGVNPVLLKVRLGDDFRHYGGLIWRDERGQHLTKEAPKKALDIPKGGYVALGPHPFGSFGVFCLDSEGMRAFLNGNVLYVGRAWEGRRLRKGEKVNWRLLLVLTQGGEGTPEFWEEMRRSPPPKEDALFPTSLTNLLALSQ